MADYMEPGARERQGAIGKVRYGGLAKTPATTADPMTDDRMALVELLQKSGEGDFLRAVAEAACRS